MIRQLVARLYEDQCKGTALCKELQRDPPLSKREEAVKMAEVLKNTAFVNQFRLNDGMKYINNN